MYRYNIFVTVDVRVMYEFRSKMDSYLQRNTRLINFAATGCKSVMPCLQPERAELDLQTTHSPDLSTLPIQPGTSRSCHSDSRQNLVHQLTQNQKG